MKESLSIKSDIAFFPIEETQDEQIQFVGDEKFIQLFPLEYALELIESDLNLQGKGNSKVQIAERLLEYR